MWYRTHRSARAPAMSLAAHRAAWAASEIHEVRLARGLLYAGAKSLLLTLWDVHDQSTAEVMRSFYDHFRDAAENRALALKAAMLAARQRYPHPFHWAPFILMGKAS